MNTPKYQVQRTQTHPHWWPTLAAALLATCASPCEPPLAPASSPSGQATGQAAESTAVPAARAAPLVSDANGNGVDDWVDIAVGTSLDENANAIPDEVEAEFTSVRPAESGTTDGNRGISDCNGNGIEDWVDIQTGFSEDVNGNAIPDEVEAEHAHHANTTAGSPVQDTRKP
ncbi:MAG: hypothetical protein GY711_01475 [bacterium]|nr:hypothetical protein [bacterium]